MATAHNIPCQRWGQCRDDAGEWAGSLILSLPFVHCEKPKGFRERSVKCEDHVGGFVEDGLERARQVAGRPAVVNSTWKDPPSNIATQLVSLRMGPG